MEPTDPKQPYISSCRPTLITAQCEEDARKKDRDSDTEESRHFPLVPLPSRKERRKEMSLVMCRMNKRLHDLDWSGFEKYGNELLKKQPDNLDYQACIVVHKPYALRVTSGAHNALQYLEMRENVVKAAPSSDFLMIRFLMMKAFLLHFLGRQREAQMLHEQAIHESEFLEASNPSAHNLYYYALNTLLHNRDLWGPDQMPLESTWARAEHCYKQSAQEHMIWVEDLDDDPKLSGDGTIVYFLSALERYVMCRLRSCASAYGFNTLIRGQRIPSELLDDIERNLDTIKKWEGHLSFRGWMNYCIARCDYNLRCCLVRTDRNKYLSEAERWARHATEFPCRYPEAKLSAFVRTFAECRLEYIQQKKSSGLDDSGVAPPCPNLTDLQQSQHMSHMDYSKAEYCPQRQPRSGSNSSFTVVKCAVSTSNDNRRAAEHQDLVVSDPNEPSQCMVAETLVKSPLAAGDVGTDSSLSIDLRSMESADLSLGRCSSWALRQCQRANTHMVAGQQQTLAAQTSRPQTPGPIVRNIPRLKTGDYDFTNKPDELNTSNTPRTSDTPCDRSSVQDLGLELVSTQSEEYTGEKQGSVNILVRYPHSVHWQRPDAETLAKTRDRTENKS